MIIRPRRSVLFLPASNARMIEKARGLAADAIVLDLEDAVAPERKETARRQACEAVDLLRDRDSPSPKSSGLTPEDLPPPARGGSREIVVRINALDSPWGADDLMAVRTAKPDAVLLPKVSGADAIKAALGEVPVWAMIETPLAVLNLAAIAASGAACLVLGANDLVNGMHARMVPDRRNLWSVMTAIVIAARAHGLGVIDGTFNDIADAEGFAAACAEGKAFGFDGKTLIHPGQVEAANRIFAPAADEIAAARKILAAFDAPENQGRGAIALDGRMVERLHAENAARLLALADAIAERA